MEIRHLKYFLTVAEELNFSRAAQKLHMAQPPLSMQIKTLENELGVKLLERSSRCVKLTVAGKSFLEDTKHILKKISEAEERVKKAEIGIVEKIEIGFIPSLANDFLASILRKFRALYPKVEVNLFETNSQNQVTALLEGKLDLGFVRPIPHGPGLHEETILEEQMVLAVPANHPLAQKQNLDWEDLHRQSLIMVHSKTAAGFYDSFLTKCKQAGIEVITEQNANDVHAKLWLVSAGFGLAPTIRSMRYIQRPNLVFCNLPTDAPRIKIGMAWKKKNSSAVLKNFISVTRGLIQKYKSSEQDLHLV